MLWFSSINVSLYCNADLKILEVTHNQIHTLPDDIGALRHLECLYMRHNKLTNIPSLDNCTALKVSIAVTTDGQISNPLIKILPDLLFKSPTWQIQHWTDFK